MSDPISPQFDSDPAEPAQDSTLESVKTSPASAPIAQNRSAKARQLLGMRGAEAGETSIWKIRLQLMKPVTWIPLMWGVICGATSSGGFTWTLSSYLAMAACMLLAGPLLTGYTQTLNEFYDRDVDAVNEPYRPIPSGAISVPQATTQIIVLLLAGVGVAYGLDQWAGHDFPTITVMALGGSFLSYIYSAPPLRLKQNGWLGGYALGTSYIALPWWASHALFGDLNPTIVILLLVYSLAGLGIAVVNDFKSVEGDRQFGLQSLPVMFGINSAAWICVLLIDIFQAAIVAYLISIHENLYAAILVLLIIPQITFQDMYFLRDPLENDVKYQASAQPFLVLGMLVTGLALGHAGV